MNIRAFMAATLMAASAGCFAQQSTFDTNIVMATRHSEITGYHFKAKTFNNRAATLTMPSRLVDTGGKPFTICYGPVDTAERSCSPESHHRTLSSNYHLPIVEGEDYEVTVSFEEDGVLQSTTVVTTAYNADRVRAGHISRRVCKAYYNMDIAVLRIDKAEELLTKQAVRDRYARGAISQQEKRDQMATIDHTITLYNQQLEGLIAAKNGC